MNQTQKTLIALAISSILLTGCGGGGVSVSVYTGDSTVVAVHPERGEYKTETGEIKTSALLQQSIADKKAYTDGNGINVLLIDTGVDLKAGSLKNAKIDKKMTYISHGSSQVVDTHSFASRHGTYMSEIIYQLANNTYMDNIAYNADAPDAAWISDGLEAADVVSQNKHIDIINLSLGNSSSTYIDDPEQYKITYAPLAADAKKLVDRGLLFVIASGNDSNKNPEDSALLPLSDPSLLKGYIVATGVD